MCVCGGGGQKRIERLREDRKRNGVWRESEGQMGWGRGGARGGDRGRLRKESE